MNREPIEKILYIKSKADNSHLNIELHPSMQIYNNRSKAYLSLLSIDFKYNVPNISEKLFNNFFNIYIAGGGWQTIYINEGYYTIDNIIQGMVCSDTVKALFDIRMNPITHRVDFILRASGMQFDFTNGLLGTFLGFENDEYYVSTQNIEIYPALNPPVLNNISRIFVNCSLSNTTASYNGVATNIIESIPINSSEVSYSPINPLAVDISGCIGGIIDNIAFWLSDISGNKIDLNGESWSAKFLIEIL